MLLFRAEENIEEWVRTTGEKRGECLTLQKVWELSQMWYHNRMSLDYRGRTVEEVHAIFESVGLTSSFWKFHEG